MIILVSIAPLVDRTSVQPNGNTSEYCSISGQDIGTTGMVILVNTTLISGQYISTTGMVIIVSTAPLVDRTSV